MIIKLRKLFADKSLQNLCLLIRPQHAFPHQLNNAIGLRPDQTGELTRAIGIAEAETDMNVA